MNAQPYNPEPYQQPFPPMAEGDEKLYVMFYMGSLPNAEKTAEEGHPVFDSRPFVKIMVPGDKNTVIDTLVDATHKRRFAKQWHNFEVNQTSAVDGLPLREWPAISRAQSDELYHMNIVTVEQLATVADVYGSKIMGFNELRRKAQAYLQNAKDSALAIRLDKENADLRQELKDTKDEMKRLSDLFEKLEKKGK